jgi:hypothetical protein
MIVLEELMIKSVSRAGVIIHYIRAIGYVILLSHLWFNADNTFIIVRT